MLFRRNLIITLFSLSVFSFASFAQSASYLDSLKGKYALQFQISDNFNLTNFQGTTFSGKYHFGCRSAVRLGLSVDLISTENDLNEMRLDTSVTNKANSKQDGFGMTIRAQYLQYIPRIYDIAFFFGGGPYIRFNSTTLETSDPDTDPVLHTSENISSTYIGVDLLIGVEWMFSKNMSLSAEYGIQFYHSSSTRESESNYINRKTTEKTFRITNGDLNFGISVYF